MFSTKVNNELEGKGGFSKQRKELLYIVINDVEVVQLKKIIKEIDEKAYVTIYPVYEIVEKDINQHKRF
ncbi:DUF2179 domain-containing protein [Fervidibacillus halotolerans]|uniref:DUF2179 domain-containing protein n=1 Tax=Fervidibacillus halotolerans TaxID=2980027 RepID=A0A9E8LZP7_9BACI|nr:DUF2179 domain-containing protein [Fervidibacillus halotolerans]WAA12260.1 DUF2179 domain-containing protein [Fervidibacillus halotolerans]